MIEVGNWRWVIDSGPDFRQQMLREGVRRLDGLVFTHEHKDHLAGTDDIRAFNFLQKRDMPVFADVRVQAALRRDFHYAFGEVAYSGVPRMKLVGIDEAPFLVNGVTWWPLPVMHDELPVLGFRVGGLAYITDANSLTQLAYERLEGVDVLVLNALRRTPHPSHFSLEEALEVVARVRPKRAFFTHISHLLGEHDAVNLELRELQLRCGVELAYDGLVVESDGPSFVEGDSRKDQ
jgi:phosphoribosyl 1,2-cyclic phosphate phosphodiesterase